MEEKDWIILKTLYEEKNITKTAEKLFITQPALTYRIQAIEQEFGVKIVNRGKKGVDFTFEGEYVYRYAEKMIIEFRKVKEKLKNMDNKVQGKLRIAVSSSFAYYPLPIILKDFLTLYPDVEVNLVTGWSSEIVQNVQKQEAHLGIIRGDHHWPEAKHIISEEPIFIASKQKITLDQLPYLPRINYETDNSLKLIIDNWWNEHFTSPPLITMDVNQVEICRKMVSQGLGYAIFPSLAFIDNEELYRMNLIDTNKNPIIRKTSIIYRNEAIESSVVKAFFDFIQIKLDYLS
ncbi:LysR family transcriptional regulator [Lysinibacillus sp. BW-2-10]|uniref:LysR family transcriptional regulator n=1 Tax=Lysinibacillus sp. BW-2-10 TaxID=2590030 RepID=UPI00117BEFD2|nr:LysR family transcriptional regulator [Lysinibacillus sp. BW-2-10]TSI09306.1 LysR family transcriptional regulator [Lysinibacillus sp. BW-2-10]